ncbi:hypothetical protein F4778DRAFT_206532 [Xylariomycetidae sp. FL2044]|nr:hypothetical protein F4778DRAFT_206532 [Xylariomycetidae sp. FL2044]
MAYLAGVSHERLLIFHTWLGWAMLVLALIHTSPFIACHLGLGYMEMKWLHDVFYLTGMVALVFQGHLQFMQVHCLDQGRYLEFYKATHYVVARASVVSFFIHCEVILGSVSVTRMQENLAREIDRRQSSGATSSLPGFCIRCFFLYRQMRTSLKNGVSHRATFTMVSDLALKITVPTQMTWQPG